MSIKDQKTNHSQTQVMGRHTRLTRASSTVPNSLRTTVPNAYVELLKVKDGDDLNWEVEFRDNKVFLVVSKATDKQ